MAGTIVTDAIRSELSTPTVFRNTSGVEIGQLSRSWANFNGVTTVSIRASFNISSISRTSAGNYTPNYSNSMPSANYSITTAMGNSGTTVDGSMNILSLATGSTQIYQKVSGSNPADVAIISFSVFI